MHALLKKVVAALGSFHLSVGLFGLLALITWLGTESQETIGLFQSQKLYFESWFVTRDVGEWSVPVLPGGLLLITLLFVNLVVGGIVQLIPRVRSRTQGRSRRARLASGLGILITHVGIVTLLLACFAKYVLAEEGGLQLLEGQSSNGFVSYHDWEIVVREVAEDDAGREFLVPHHAFADRTGDLTTTVRAPQLPFRLVVSRFAPNVEIRRASSDRPVGAPVVDGFYVRPVALQKEWERNVAGCYVRAEPTDGSAATDGILWGLALHPLTVVADGRSFLFELRKQRIPMPFRIHLDRFIHEFHPNTRIPRKFMSSVTVVGDGGIESHRIRMNEPLRKDGLVVFQSSWGPENAAPGTPLFSGFSVVRNPADQWPWYSLYVIAAGMLLHFVTQLVRFLVDQAADLRGRSS